MSRKTAPSLATHRHALAQALLAWFDHAQRDMPWRKTRDPYAIWLSETMLQQTQVETVKPYYHKFLQSFPTIQSLADADLQSVLSLWAGLGYYRRARHLHAAARQMVTRHGGNVPPTVADLLSLPGVGRYTAGAIASIAFAIPAAVLDGNVMRVLSRLLASDADLRLPATQKHLWTLAESLIPAARPGDYNQALMELGATVCTPTNPRCSECPLASICIARAQGRTAQLPIKSKAAPQRHIKLTALVLSDPRGRLLLLQRPAGGLWEEMWEFPALITRATLNSAPKLDDVVREELGVNIKLSPHMGALAHVLSHRRLAIRIAAGRCPHTRGLTLPACPGSPGHYRAARWLPADQLAQVPTAALAARILLEARRIGGNRASSRH